MCLCFGRGAIAQLCGIIGGSLYIYLYVGMASSLAAAALSVVTFCVLWCCFYQSHPNNILGTQSSLSKHEIYGVTDSDVKRTVP